MIYYLGQALSVTYFLDLPLRTWAESKVYGPLSYFNFRSCISLILLLFPFLVVTAIRVVLFKVRS